MAADDLGRFPQEDDREARIKARDEKRIPEGAVARASTYCRRCSRHLSAKASIRHGYGSKCWKKVARRSRVDEETGHLEPCTITDEAEAAGTRREMRKRLLRPVREDEYRRVECHCGRHLSEADLLSFDTDTGPVLRGYAKPQWFYFLCECGYQYAIWKLGDLGPIEAGLTTGEVLPGGRPTMEAFREGGDGITPTSTHRLPEEVDGPKFRDEIPIEKVPAWMKGPGHVESPAAFTVEEEGLLPAHYTIPEPRGPTRGEVARGFSRTGPLAGVAGIIAEIYEEEEREGWIR